MRLVIAECQVDYSGRLSAHLPKATRLIMVKADGSVSVHADDRAYKPLNWMSAPCTMDIAVSDDESWINEIWRVTAKNDDCLIISLGEVYLDSTHQFGEDPGLQKDGVEAHLQELLAQHPETFGDLSLVRREYPTAIGPVDIMFRPNAPAVEIKHVAVEVKRRATIDSVEQLTRYLELLNRDPLLRPVSGVLAAQTIAQQAQTLAADRGIAVKLVDYDELRGLTDPSERLF
ncbi:MAG: endonuclease [Propionibacterium sp.]|nr:MAG: endonuclease [Propionibacterium sp.]